MSFQQKKIIQPKKQKFIRKKIKKKPFVLKINKSVKIIIFLLISLFLITFRNTLKRKSFDEFKPHKVFIEAHRGVNRQKFENTKESIELAIKYGLDSFETDLWLSKDKVGVLVHGKSPHGEIKHFYNRNYKVIYTNWSQLSTLYTRKGKLKMPKLEDIIKLTKNKIFMNLEIKDPRVDLVFPYIIKLLKKYNYFDQISISSFNHNYYKKVYEFNKYNKLGKKLSFGFIISGGNSKYYPYHAPHNSLNLYWKKVTKQICDKAHANKMAVMAWFYMNENETFNIYQRLFDYGIDIICSNDPLNAKKFRDLYYKKKKKEKRKKIIKYLT